MALFSWIIFFAIICNTFLLIAIGIREVSRPMQALAWVIIGLAVPIVGPLLYLAVASPLRIRRPHMRSDSVSMAKLPSDFTQTTQTLCQSVSRSCDVPLQTADVQVLHNGRETYGRLVETLRTATHRIDLEYYIYRDDHIGRTVTDILVERATAGVKVRCMFDGWGSRQLPSGVIQRLTEAGVQCRTFFPVRFPWLSPKLNHRDHCKIVIVDKLSAFVGGINIGDEYASLKPGKSPWRDTHLYIEGKAVTQLQSVFLMNWSIGTPTGKARTTKRQGVPGRKWGVAAATGEWANELGIIDNTPRSKSHQAWVQAVESGPDVSMENIQSVFFSCLTQAQKSVDITTPYFGPGPDVTMALKAAILRGVRVRLLIPKKPDHAIVGYASRAYFNGLFDAGVELYLYDRGILHAKVMTVDGEVSVVGAANYDQRSLRLNYEVAAVAYSPEVTADLTGQFEQDLKHATRLTEEMLAAQTRMDRVRQYGARLLAPLL